MDLHRKPDVTIPDGAPPAELVIDDLVVGDGRKPPPECRSPSIMSG